MEFLPAVADTSVLEVPTEEVKAAILLFYSLLDEQHRRLYMPGWSRSSWAVAATANWPTFSIWIPIPWPVGVNSY